MKSKNLWDDIEFLRDDFKAIVPPEHIPAALKEMTDRTEHHLTDPSYLDIFSIVRQSRNKKGERCLVLAHIEPVNANIKLLMPETPEECYFRKENGTIGELSLSWFKDRGMSDELIDDILSQGLFFQYKDAGATKTFIPSKLCMAVLAKQLGAGKPEPGINPLRDLYLASVMNCHDDITLITRKGGKFDKIFGALSSKTRLVPQTTAIDILEKIREREKAEFVYCDIDHSRTLVDIELSDREVYGYRPIIRIQLGGIGRIKYCMYTGLKCHGKTILGKEICAKRGADPEEALKLMLDAALKEIESHDVKYKLLADTTPLKDPAAEMLAVIKKIKLAEAVGITKADFVVEKLCAELKGSEKKDVYHALLKAPMIAEELDLFPYKILEICKLIGNVF